MVCPYSPSGKNKVKCELYNESAVVCNVTSMSDFCRKFKELEGE